MRVVVAGGTGFIGRNLVKWLRGAGHEVTLVSRGPPAISAGGEGGRHMTWEQLGREGAPECDAVVNLCGENVFQPRLIRAYGHEYKHDMRASRVDTTNMLSAALRKSGVRPKVVMVPSAIGIYATEEERQFDEQSPLPDVGGDFLRQLCHDVEASGRRAAEENSCDLVALRIGLVLGKDGGLFQQLKLPFSLGLGGNFGDGTQPMPWVHIADMCAIVQFLLEREGPPVGGPVNCVAPARHTNADFTRAMASSPAVCRLARGVAFLHTPALAISAVFGRDRAMHMLSRATVVPAYLANAGFQFQFTDLHLCVNDIASQ